MLWQRRNVAIASRCAKSSFSLTENMRCNLSRGWRPSNTWDGCWTGQTTTGRNFGKSRRLWSRLGKLLRIEGEDPRVSEIFYQSVVQAVLLFEAEIWILLVDVSRYLEGVHVIFLIQMTGYKAKQQRYRTWRRESASRVLREGGGEDTGGIY